VDNAIEPEGLEEIRRRACAECLRRNKSTQKNDPFKKFEDLARGGRDIAECCGVALY